MKRLLLSLLIVIALASPAHAEYAAYKYRACFNNNNLHFHVCYRATIQQQSDGIGWNIDNPSTYVTDTDTGDPCSQYLEPGEPQVVNYYVHEWGHRDSDGTVWQTYTYTSPDLVTSNSCDHGYPFVSVNHQGLLLSFYFKERLDNRPDVSVVVGLWLDPPNGGDTDWGCLSQTDECVRTLVT